MIKKPFVLAQILLIAFVLSRVTEGSDLALTYPVETTAGIAIVTVGLVVIGNVLWDKVKAVKAKF